MVAGSVQIPAQWMSCVWTGTRTRQSSNTTMIAWLVSSAKKSVQTLGRSMLTQRGLIGSVCLGRNELRMRLPCHMYLKIQVRDNLAQGHFRKRSFLGPYFYKEKQNGL